MYAQEKCLLTVFSSAKPASNISLGTPTRVKQLRRIPFHWPEGRFMVKDHEPQTEGQKLLKQLKDEYRKVQPQAQRSASESIQIIAAAESYLEPSLPI
jgi:hypothetical protein